MKPSIRINPSATRLTLIRDSVLVDLHVPIAHGVVHPSASATPPPHVLRIPNPTCSTGPHFSHPIPAARLSQHMHLRDFISLLVYSTIIHLDSTPPRVPITIPHPRLPASSVRRTKPARARSCVLH